MPMTVKPGDVFAAKLADGRYKVVRVLRKVGKSSLVSTSDYLGEEQPALDDPRLRKTVVQNRFFYKRELQRLNQVMQQSAEERKLLKCEVARPLLRLDFVGATHDAICSRNFGRISRLAAR